MNIFQNTKTTLSIFTKINNLLNEKYSNVFIGGAEGFPNVPQRPRVWTIGVKLNY